ncbi:unnamed protein product, partial [Symbiodinium microadriaticum]
MGWFDDNFDNFLGHHYGIGMFGRHIGDDCDMDEGECVNCGKKGMKFESAMDKGIDWGLYTGHPDAIRTCNKCKKDHKSCMTEVMAVKKYKVLGQGDAFKKLRQEGRYFTQKPEAMGMQCRKSTYFWVVDLEEAAAKLGWQPKENSKAMPKESTQATKRTASVAGMLGLPKAKAQAAVNADGKPVRRYCYTPPKRRLTMKTIHVAFVNDLKRWDFSDRPPNCRAGSCLTAAARLGDTAEVKSIVEERIGKGFLHYPDFLLNYCAKYHEVDYKMGGYTKEWDWFKYTPVVAAAKNGHIECVRVLLLNGACPVLQCCEIDDVCEDALQAASSQGGWLGNSIATELEKLERGEQLQSYSSLVQQAGNDSCQTVIKNALARAKKSAELEALVKVAMPFWHHIKDRSAHWNEKAARNNQKLVPSDGAALRAAVERFTFQAEEGFSEERAKRLAVRLEEERNGAINEQMAKGSFPSDGASLGVARDKQLASQLSEEHQCPKLHFWMVWQMLQGEGLCPPPLRSPGFAWEVLNLMWELCNLQFSYLTRGHSPTSHVNVTVPALTLSDKSTRVIEAKINTTLEVLANATEKAEAQASATAKTSRQAAVEVQAEASATQKATATAEATYTAYAEARDTATASYKAVATANAQQKVKEDGSKAKIVIEATAAAREKGEASSKEIANSTRTVTAKGEGDVTLKIKQKGRGQATAEAEKNVTVRMEGSDSVQKSKILNVKGIGTFNTEFQATATAKAIVEAVERLGLDAKKLSGIPYARSVYKEAEREAYSQAREKATRAAVDLATKEATKRIDEDIDRQADEYKK